MLALKQAVGEARAAGHTAVSAEVLGEHSGWFREAAAAGIALNAARATALQRSGTPSPPGSGTAPATTCASPLT